MIVLAHHPLVTALPFVVPALIVVALVVAVVVRDRREERQEAAAAADPQDRVRDVERI